MGIKLIVIVVSILVLVASVVGALGTKKKFLTVLSIILTIASIGSLVIVPASIHVVDTGEVAVVKYLGDARKLRTAGTYFDWNLLYEYQTYDSKVQNVEINTMTYSSDAQTMDITMTLQYQIMGDKVLDIAKQYGSLEALQARIQSIAIEKTKAVLSAHKAMDIIAKRAEMSPAVEDAIKSAIDDNYFVNVNTVVLTNIDFSDAFETAVEEKMIAEQQQLKANYENETKVAQAQAAADAKRIEVQAEKDANDLLQKSLTDEILRQNYIDKWDGKLPQYVGDGSGVIVDITD